MVAVRRGGFARAGLSLAALIAGTSETQAQTIGANVQRDPALSRPELSEPVEGPALVAPLPPAVAHAPDDGALKQSFDLAIETEWVSGKPSPKPDQAFPVLIKSSRSPLCTIGSYLSEQWILACLRKASGAERDGQFTGTRPALGDAIDAINRIFYENGYVDSGLRVSSEASAQPRSNTKVTLKLIVGTLAQCDPKKRSDKRLVRYAEAQLAHGCRLDQPFNAYLLEQNFRLLAGGDVVERVNVKLEPDKRVAGLAWLRQLDKPLEGKQPDLVVVKRPIQIWGTVANDRSPSVGSIRSAVGAQWRTPLPFLVVRGEVGETDGVTDYAGDLIAELSPDLRASFSGDHSDAAIIDPALRALDIRSKTTGFSGTLSYHLLRCPLAPQFAAYPLPDPGDKDRWKGAMRRSESDGLLNCPLPVRLAEDVPTRWKPLRDIAVSFTVARRVTDTSLLGVPFSFAPGAVDGRSKVVVARTTIDWLEAGRYGSRGERGWTLAARLTASHGLSGTRATVPGLINPSPHFTSIYLQWNGAVQLPMGQLVLSTSGGAQWSNGPLYTSERLPIGGATTVRGYELGTLLADRAAYGSVTLTRDFLLTGGHRLSTFPDFDPGRFRLGVFADLGFGRDLAPLVEPWRHIASAGVLAAWRPSRALSAELDWARRFDTTPAAYQNSLLRHGINFRVEFRPLELIRRKDK